MTATRASCVCTALRTQPHREQWQLLVHTIRVRHTQQLAEVVVQPAECKKVQIAGPPQADILVLVEGVPPNEQLPPPFLGQGVTASSSLCVWANNTVAYCDVEPC